MTGRSGKKRSGMLKKVGIGVIALALIGAVFGENDNDKAPRSDAYSGIVAEERAKVESENAETVTLRVPGSSSELESLEYDEAVLLLEDAGFTNVKSIGEHIEYSADVKTGDVVAVSIDDSVVFDENAEFKPDAQILVYYRAAEPAPEPGFTPEPAPTPSVTPSQTPAPAPAAAQTPSPSREVSSAPSQTPKPSQSQPSDGNQGSGTAVKETEAPSGNTAMCWIPTNGGTKYHTRSSCSNMDNPIQVTVNEAQQLGFTACKRCH